MDDAARSAAKTYSLTLNFMARLKFDTALKAKTSFFFNNSGVGKFSIVLSVAATN